MNREHVLIYALISVFLWGSVPVMIKLILRRESLDLTLMLTYVTAFTSISLLIFNILTNGIRKETNYLVRGDHKKRVLLGIFAFYLGGLLFYLGVANMEASIAMIINYTWPLWIAVLSWPILNERMDNKQIAGLVVCFVGIVMIAISEGLNFEGVKLLPMIYAIGGAVSWAMFTVLSRKFNIDASKEMAYIALYSLPLFILTVMLKNSFVILNTSQLLPLIMLAVLGTAIPHTTWIIATTKARKVSDVINVVYITPIITVISAKIMLSEVVHPVKYLGMLVVLYGVWMAKR